MPLKLVKFLFSLKGHHFWIFVGADSSLLSSSCSPLRWHCVHQVLLWVNWNIYIHTLWWGSQQHCVGSEDLESTSEANQGWGFHVTTTTVICISFIGQLGSSEVFGGTNQWAQGTLFLSACRFCLTVFKINLNACVFQTISKPVEDPSELPKWNYDGSSTGQAPGEDSEVIL